MGRVISGYVSDHTKFIDAALAKNPAWVEDQAKGRALWWDRPQTLDEMQRNQASRVAQKGYPYDVSSAHGK